MAPGHKKQEQQQQPHPGAPGYLAGLHHLWRDKKELSDARVWAQKPDPIIHPPPKPICRVPYRAVGSRQRGWQPPYIASTAPAAASDADQGAGGTGSPPPQAH